MLYVVKSKRLRDVKERQQKIVLVKREVQRVPLRSAETDIESTLCSFCVMEANDEHAVTHSPKQQASVPPEHLIHRPTCFL